jgi:acetyl-CoA acetyltransferase
MELAFDAILAALDDAGLSVSDVDGLTQYTTAYLDAAPMAAMLGIDQLRFSAVPTGGGGGSAGSVALAAMAVHSGLANVVVGFHSSQFAPASGPTAFAAAGMRAASWHDFIRSPGLVAPGPMFAMMVQRHMYEFGTRREALAEVAISTRMNATKLESSMFRKPLTIDDYMEARILATPFCLFDYCMQSDGAVAYVITSKERARDLRKPPALIAGVGMGGPGAWGEGEEWLQMPDDLFTTSGYGTMAKEMYASAGIGPEEVSVASFYDHFTGMVLLQLEDFGLAPRGESGPFVEGGGIRFDGGKVPINTDGGSLSHANCNGATHVVEATRQIRGEATNQVKDANVALFTGAPGKLTLSSVLLRRDS